MKILFTHIDLDGSGCSVLAHILSSKNLIKFDQIIYANYGDIDDKIDRLLLDSKNLEEVVFTDITASIDSYRKLQEYKINITIFDHHITARNEFLASNINYVHYYFDNNRSGTRIFYEDFFVKYYQSFQWLNDFVTIVDTYDMWKDSSDLWNTAEDMQRLWGSYLNFRSNDAQKLYSNFVNMQIQKFFRNNTNNFSFLNDEKNTIDRIRKADEELLDDARKNIQIRTDNSGIKYIYHEMPKRISYIASAILRENQDCKYMLIRNLTSSTDFSLRCRSDFDVKDIASRMNGGGHKEASGFGIVDESLIKKIKSGEFHIN